jgi:hypothetical protein
MDTGELMVYLVFAVVVAGLFLFFLKGLPFIESGEKVDTFAQGKTQTEFRNQNTEALIRTIIDFWNANKFKDTRIETTVYVQEPGLITKATLFDSVTRENQCQSLQSAEQSCGQREDVIMGVITTPAVIRLVYENDTLIIEPEIEATQNFSIATRSITFGGFEGQGVIEKHTDAIPQDAIILSMKLKAHSGANFLLLMNGRQCLDEFKTRLSVERWDVTQCRTLLLKGVENNITIQFPRSNLLVDYFGGGYLQMTYLTQTHAADIVDQYLFPGISGNINVFSSFMVPGQLTNIDGRLHYFVDNGTNDDLKFVLGNHLVHRDSDTDVEKTVILDPSMLSSLDFAALSSTTVPVRLSTSREYAKQVNVTVNQTPYDVILITDLSGSMNDPIGGTGGGMCGNPTTPKREVAICVDEMFANIILNSSNNRLGLVAYGENAPPQYRFPLTDQLDSALTEIASYVQIGSTCIPCGIVEATELLGDSTRNRTMIVMSDGEANRCLSESSPDPAVSDDCNGNRESARPQAIQMANRARQLGIEVYAVAFGEDADRETMRAIADDDEHYAEGSSPDDLEQVYQEIAKKIVAPSGLNGTREMIQTITIRNDTPHSILYPDSYLHFAYVPTTPSSGSTEIGFRVENRITGCSNTLYLPPSFKVTDASVLSFSGVFWARFVDVNGQRAYLLTDPNNLSLQLLGDPFQIYIPPSYLQPGTNTIDIAFTGNLGEDIDCSNPVYDDNSVVYSVTLGSLPSTTIGRSGCRWNVEFDDGTTREFRIPLSYTGTTQCFYTATQRSYRQTDRYDYAASLLFSELDSDHDFRLPASIEDILYYNG